MRISRHGAGANADPILDSRRDIRFRVALLVGGELAEIPRARTQTPSDTPITPSFVAVANSASTSREQVPTTRNLILPGTGLVPDIPSTAGIEKDY